MIFVLLVFLAAFLIEGIGTYVSVVGLSSLFAANPVIITLAIALDFGKVVAVSFLYKYWQKIGWFMKSYMTMAALILMLITSSGAFGFLSGEFQKAIADTSTGTIVTTALTEEQGRLQKRKEEIDKQVAQLKDDNVGGRTRLMRTFGPEIKRINDRLAEIDKELPKLKVDAIKKNVEVGPIIYVAEAFHTTPEQAVKWVILLIIFVFDPLAISLLLAGNYLVELRKQEKEEKLQKKLEDYDPRDDDITVVRASEACAQPNIVKEEMPFVAVEEENAATLQEPVQQEQELIEVVEEQIDTPVDEPMVKEELVQEVFPEIESTVEELVQELVQEVFPEIEPTVEELVLHQEIPTLEPIEEPLPITEQVDEEGHEVITLEQITKPVSSLPIHRSQLEDVNAKFGDIQTDEEDRRRSMRTILNAYESETIDQPEKGNAVSVGGPADRIR